MKTTGTSGNGPGSGLGPIYRLSKLLDQIVFSCLLGLMVLSVIPYGSVDALWEAVFECGVFTLTALWILEALLVGSWQVRRLFVLLPLILITIYAFAQQVELPGWLAAASGRRVAYPTLSIDRYQTYITARKALALTSFLGLLLLHTSTPKRLRWLVRVVIGLGLASALFGILRQLLQSPDSTAGFVLPFLFTGLGYGQFLSANVFAYLMEMVLGLVAGLVLGGGVRRDRIPIYLAIALFVWTALVLSSSRGAILGLACQFIFLLFISLNWYSARRLSRGDGGRLKWLNSGLTSRLIRVLSVVLMVGTLIAGVLWMGGDRLGLKLAKESKTSSQITSDGTSRKEIWRSGWEIIKRHPGTGVGFGAFFLAVPEYQTGAGLVKVEQAHNDYLDLAANGGIVAVALAGWFIALVIWRARSPLRSRDAYRRAAALGAAAGILSVAVHSLVDFGLQITGVGVVFAALVVILVADNRVEALSHRRQRQ